MIKFLRFTMLSMLMMLCGTAFAADDATIPASNLSALAEGNPVAVSGYTFTVFKNDGSTKPTYNANNGDYRLYAKNTLTIKAESGNMTKIVFNISTQGKKRLAPITASTGTIASQASGDETVTWTGNANEVTFTVGEKANYGSDGADKAGQFDFSSVVFGAGGSTPDPDPDQPGETGEVKKVTIAEFNAAAESTSVWYQLSGTVKNLKDGDQFGNFDFEDATGSVYVYGLLSEKGGEKKKFQELATEKGIKNGTKLTLIGNRGSYGDKIEVVNAYFVSVDGQGEDPDPDPDPQPTTQRNYKKVDAVTSGKAYLLVATKDGSLTAAQPVPANKTYGYLAVTNVTEKDGVISMADDTQEFVITESSAGYTIQQPDGRLFRNDAQYKTVSVDEKVETPDWTITANGDGTFKIQNATTGKWLQLDTEYGTYGVYDEEKGAMPALYEFDSETKPEAVLTISGDEEFEVSTTVTITPSNPDNLVYYTLDGSDPATNSAAIEYKAPFTITETTTVKAYEEGAELTAEKTFTKKEVSYPEAADIAAFKALEDKTVAKLNLTDAQVVYTWTTNNGNTSTYVRDNSGAIVFYNTGLDLKANQMVNGSVVLQYSVYNNLPEAVKANATSADNLTITDGEAPEAKAIEVSAAGDNLCDLVVLNGVKVVKEEDGKYYAVKGEDKVQVYNGFHIADFDNLDAFLSDSETVSVKGIMVVFKQTYEIYPIEIGATSDGIENINNNTVNNGKMFNMAGQRVNGNYKGVVIVNGKKTILK